MTESPLVEAFHTLQRVVLGVLVALLGMFAYGIAIRAFPNGQYLTAVLASAASIVALLGVVALFVEGWREGAKTT